MEHSKWKQNKTKPNKQKECLWICVASHVENQRIYTLQTNAPIVLIRDLTVRSRWKWNEWMNERNARREREIESKAERERERRERESFSTIIYLDSLNKLFPILYTNTYCLCMVILVILFGLFIRYSIVFSTSDHPTCVCVCVC